MANDEPIDLLMARLSANNAQFMGDEREAIQIAEQALAFYPEDEQLLSVLAMGYCRIGLFQNAHEYAAKLISLFPESARCNVLYARATAGIGNKDEAIKYANRSIALDPNHTDSFELRGYIYRDIGWFNSCAEDMTQAIKLGEAEGFHKAVAYWYHVRGTCYAQIGLINEAREDLEKGLAGNPVHSGILLAYCKFCVDELRQPELAQKAVERFETIGGRLDEKTRLEISRLINN